jgi:hypothetical protein
VPTPHEQALEIKRAADRAVAVLRQRTRERDELRAILGQCKLCGETGKYVANPDYDQINDVEHPPYLPPGDYNHAPDCPVLRRDALLGRG